ncbi:MAG: hypothetical protein P4L35_00555 [Ignavibacteriaceae bacterium]|nr:hypothetical protein [Ignavibacteriaceae bacterium]
MNDNMALEPLGVKGHVRVELHDAETGELTDVQEGDNFISNVMYTLIMKQVQKILFAGNIPNNGIGFPIINSGSYGVFDGMFRNLVLTDSTLAESPTTETNIPGNMVGWANKVPYVGTSAYQGTINQIESFATENLVHWSFDFATSVANGTINSVCWGFVYPEVAGYMLGSKLISQQLTYLGRCARTYSFVCAGDGFFWGTVGTALYKIDPVSYAEIATYTLAFAPGAYSMCVNNGFIYYYGNSYVRKQNILLGTVVTSVNSSCYPYAVDATYVYCIYPTSPSYFYRLKVSDLTQVDAKYITINVAGVPTNLYTYCMYMRGGNLYVMCYTGYSYPAGIYLVNYVAGTATLVNGSNFLNDVKIFSDGTTLFLPYTENNNFNNVGNTSTTMLASFPNAEATVSYNLMARKLLPSPITKTSAKTMKIIYEFTFS